MGILSRSLGIQAGSLEDPSQPLLPYSALFESLGLGRSNSGLQITEKGSLRSSPIFSAAKILSEDLSKIPLNVRFRMPDDSERLAREHYVHSLIHDEPNERMSASVMRAAWITSAFLFGNGYLYVQRNKAARVQALYNMPSDKTTAVLVKGEYFFVTTATEDGLPKAIAAANILHLVGLSLDGMVGFSPVTTCKDVAGIALAAEKYAALFFGNGARTTGVLTHPEVLEAEARENIARSVSQWATGDNAFRPLLLEEGMTWTPISINPDEGQMIETRKFQVEEASRLSRIPLHKMGELSKSTNNNIEHQALEHRGDALQPWAVKVEQEINRKLLGGNYFCEHDFDDLERGDSQATANAVMTIRNAGLATTNEGRKRLRMNPISTEEGGDVVTVQGANIPLKALVNYVPPPDGVKPGGSGGKPQRAIPAAYRRLFRDAIGRASNRPNDTEFAQRTLHTIVSSMAEGVVVEKYGIHSLSPKDQTTVNGIVAGLELGDKDLSALATRITEHVYDALEKGL